jgi:diguanylate cyclase (GGDEF)-like protein/PAS domain S-box-containing protein
MFRRIICALRIADISSMADNSDELLHLFIDQAPVAIAMFDRDMHYIAASRRWVSDYHLDDRWLRGLSHYEVFPDLPDRWREIHRRALDGEVVSLDEDRFERADGQVQWLRWEVRPWFAETAQGGITIFAEDITGRKLAEERDMNERKRAQVRILQLNAVLEERVRERTAQLEVSVANLRRALQEAEGLRQELREQAIRDPLTGLFNRRFLEETLVRELARARRAQLPLTVLMIDMDNFKQLNDNFGHAAGDAVLCGVSQLVASKMRTQDVVCRFGGDEFIIVMPETSLENASRKAQQLLGRLRHLSNDMLDMNLPEIEFSVGVAAFPDHGATGIELLKSVDGALYRAKQQGGGRVVAAA